MIVHIGKNFTFEIMKMMRLKISRKAKGIFIIGMLVVISFGSYAFLDKDFKIAKNLDIFVTLFREVDAFYVDETDPEKLIESSIQGMLKDLDPYTTFIAESDMDELKFMTTGQYGGIGALIRRAGEYTMIAEPYEGYPAQIAGLRAGDTILSINGVSIKGKTISDVSELLKGTPNTPISIKVKRYKEDEAIEKSFNRERVSIRNVPYSGLVTEDIGYIRLQNFTKDASKEVKKALANLKKQEAKSVVLDLRGNPGGLLNEAVSISNIWIEKGQEIVSTRGKIEQLYKSYVTETTAVDTSIPVVVLVNRGSASASEIVAGSLQDLDRAVVIGQKTFGKGLVQTTRPLSYNTHLKITTAKYYIPSGRCIQALDYTHRNEDGSVGYVPDSLISEYKTTNGRSVFDGGGIDPDIKTDIEVPANITMEVFIQNFIFDFATKFSYDHDSIAEAEDFEITDEIYSDFVNYLNDKHFEYSTASKESYNDLVKTAKQEGYYENAIDEFNALKTKLVANKSNDLETYKDEISELLREEIVSRYYYQKGRIITSLKNDPELLKAIEVLNTENKLASILNGTYKGEDLNEVALHR